MYAPVRLRSVTLHDNRVSTTPADSTDRLGSRSPRRPGRLRVLMVVESSAGGTGRHVLDPGLAHWKRLFYLSIELLLSLRTSRVIAVSPEESRAAARVGLDRSRLVTIPNGVAPADLTPRADARRLMGVSKDAMVIGFVG